MNKTSAQAFKRFKLGDFTTLIGLIGLAVVLSILSPVFLTANNINNIIAQSSINACVAIGMTMVIITAGIDLSVGSIVAVSGIIMAKALKAGLPVPLCLLIGLAVGALCGSFNGILITKGKLPPFIATLGMMSMGRGIALIFSDGRQISTFPSTFRFFGNGRILHIPTQTIIVIALYILFYFIMRYTRLGRYCYAIGGNEEATRLSGINITRYKIIIYSLNGVLAATASIILAARLNSAQPIAGEGYELDAIAASVIGGASLEGGQGKILFTLVGALIIGVLRNGLTILNVSSYIQQVVIGAVIVVAVLVDKVRK